MRLINIHSFRLEEFFGRNIPPYHILSHTWGDDEISFQEYTWLQTYAEKVAAGVIEEKPPKQRERLKAKDESLRRRSGYQKIIHFAQLVPTLQTHDHHTADYIWVDTCCINKESSAELSEAINSMYQWYKGAELCIAFLADVEDTKDAPDSDFGKSRWFFRGWTLQELLAPRWVLFYNNRWEYITERNRGSQTIKKVTGIDDRHLTLFGDYKTSVAEKMSWAAKRHTTRLEDEAYCLMGIFGINMPLLYGEGKKAFVRLQEEIIKRDGDQTIFAWGYNRKLEFHSETFGMLAQSPRDFEHCGEVKLINVSLEMFFHDEPVLTPYHMTNFGLQISVALFFPEEQSIIFAILPCVVDGHVLGFPIQFDVPEELQDGDIVCRTFEHPIALFPYVGPWPSNIIWRTVIVSGHPDPPGSPLGSNYIHLDPGLRIDILETWPKCAVDRFYKPLIRCASFWQAEQSTTFFRIRVESTERPAEFVVIVVLKPEITSRIQVRVVEWEIFRGTRTFNDELSLSLTGLFIAAPKMLDPASWPKDESKYISTTIKGGSRGHIVSLDWGT